MANLQVVIGGQDLSQYVESLERENHLCLPGHTFTLTMSSDTPRTNLNPWATAVLYEQGTKVLTGYVEQVYYNRPPAKIVVRGKDNWKRASDWFIHEELYSTGEKVGAWASYFCNLVGLSYTFVATSGSANAVKIDLQLGLKHVSEALLAVCAYAGWCIRVNPNGIVEFRNTLLPKTSTRSITVIQESEDESSDIDTRNAVKVWGMFTSGSLQGSQLMYSAVRPVPGITPDRIMVFGDPNIDTVSKARALGKAALDQFADITRIAHKKIVPIPALQVGDMIRYFSSGSAVSYYQTATDLHSLMTTSDYSQTVTLGRRCFRLPSFPITSGSFGFLCWGDSLQEITFDGSGDPYSIGAVCEAQGSSIGIVSMNTAVNGDWHIERRNMQYQIIWEVNKPVPNPGFGTQHYEYGGCCVADSLFIYTGGGLTDLFQTGPLVEKRSIASGATSWSLQSGTAPGLGGNQVWDLAVDANGLYCATVYRSDIGSENRQIEKRLLSTGAVSWGVLLDYTPLGVDIDENGIYVCGTSGKVQKRSFVDGSLIWANSPGSIQCNDIKVGFDGIYVASSYAWTSGSTGGAIEKYDKDNGALLYRVYREVSSGNAIRLDIRGHCLFVMNGAPEGFYVEHRNTGDGRLKVQTLLSGFNGTPRDMSLFPADLVICSPQTIQQRTF